MKHFLFTYLVFTCLFVFSLQSEIVESIYYFVNDDLISQSDFEYQYQLSTTDPQYKGLNPEVKKTLIISNLILNKLVEQKLNFKGRDISDLEVSNRIKQLMNESGINDFKDFKTMIQRSFNISYQDYFNTIKSKMRYSAFISEFAIIPPPSPQEIKAYYLEHRETKFKITYPLYDLSLIAVDLPLNASFSTKKKIERQLFQVIEKIKQEKISFEEAVLIHSQDRAIKKSKGRLGWVDPSFFGLTPMEREVIDNLARKGSLSKPIVVKQKLVIYRLNEKKNRGYYPEELALKISRQMIGRDLREKTTHHLIKQLHESAYIKLNTPDLDYLPPSSSHLVQ